MVFQFPNFGDVQFGDIMYHWTFAVISRYNFTSTHDDHLALYDLENLFIRVNASVTDIPELKSEPANATKWDDFSPIYMDYEIGLLNPVDKKVNSVSIGFESDD